MNSDLITSILQEEKLINSGNISFEALTGGVSSDIYLVSDGVHQLVVKQALPKLRVEDDWYADTSRNETEQEFIRYVQKFLPDSVPNILYRNKEHRFFVMEYLDPSFKNWKDQLLQGTFQAETARKAARMLAKIHMSSRGDDKAEKAFDTTDNFKSLRIEPYLLTTGDRNPELKELFHDEARRLASWKEAIVHGDFSPKNMMVKPGRLVLLDHEVAWYGDPAFDVAFLLNHLYLKMLLHMDAMDVLPDLSRIVWETYSNKLGEEPINKMEFRIGRLLLMLMLARVDGKSPVEYLDDARKETIRSFVHNLLTDEVFQLQEINSRWRSILNRGVKRK